jgi:type II secretory pathway component PulJ
MKQLSLILSLLSLSISAAIGVGAYMTYQKAQKILDNPEEFVGVVVEKQVSKAIQSLPISKINTEKFRLPF